MRCVGTREQDVEEEKRRQIKTAATACSQMCSNTITKKKSPHVLLLLSLNNSLGVKSPSGHQVLSMVFITMFVLD